MVHKLDKYNLVVKIYHTPDLNMQILSVTEKGATTFSATSHGGIPFDRNIPIDSVRKYDADKVNKMDAILNQIESLEKQFYDIYDSLENVE